MNNKSIVNITNSIVIISKSLILLIAKSIIIEQLQCYLNAYCISI